MDRSTASDQLFTILESEFIQRDRGIHPPAFTPTYKTSVLRSPRIPLWSLQNSARGHWADLPAGRTRPSITTSS